MSQYEVQIVIEGAWGTKLKCKKFLADNDAQAEEIAEEILENINVRYSENSWGAYEEAYIDDVVKIA